MDESVQGVLLDYSRGARIGLPEAVFCEGKSAGRLLSLLERGLNKESPILFTRLSAEAFASAPENIRAAYDYHELSRTAFAERLPPKKIGSVSIVSAGSADAAVVWEAARTLEYLGIAANVYEDNGVAGLWRLTSKLEAIASAEAIIIAAGLDAALASVLGGLTGKPLFAVPTSTGYGMAKGGESALCSMLVSCAPGIGVMNIDNGYGAACAAARVINLLNHAIETDGK
ncbi:MAG: nickel pincer cofactor biosynthesis protein LarB [Helicobacteraceae bacterium]|jgi:NCAIR mutase (PurE)-related protein|nr:nickel pincer cofactor biosynthesis protein LarB [Helicobacteraceae bacterium]